MREPQSRAPISELPEAAAGMLARLRERSPRVHCLTNAVAQTFTANILLAVGAIPSMTIAPAEIGDFVGRSDALLVNLGTFDTERIEAAELAVARANADGRRWVLDPVFIDRSPKRADFARSLAARGPAALRLNAGEYRALAGEAPDREVLADRAAATGSVHALTGALDIVSDGSRVAEIANGHLLMSRVTAMGCALSAVVAGCLAVEEDAWTATAGALLAFGVAGEVAAEQARGPGTFATAIIDALYGLDRDTLKARARLA